jgi:hypothetical protein
MTFAPQMHQNLRNILQILKAKLPAARNREHPVHVLSVEAHNPRMLQNSLERCLWKCREILWRNLQCWKFRRDSMNFASFCR